MMAEWGGGDGMVPEGRQEHEPYLYSLSYLATQCINNMNRVTKCRFTLRRICCVNGVSKYEETVGYVATCT